jgi:hypothetical protein
VQCSIGILPRSPSGDLLKMYHEVYHLQKEAVTKKCFIPSGAATSRVCYFKHKKVDLGLDDLFHHCMVCAIHRQPYGADASDEEAGEAAANDAADEPAAESPKRKERPPSSDVSPDSSPSRAATKTNDGDSVPTKTGPVQPL